MALSMDSMRLWPNVNPLILVQGIKTLYYWLFNIIIFLWCKNACTAVFLKALSADLASILNTKGQSGFNYYILACFHRDDTVPSMSQLSCKVTAHRNLVASYIIFLAAAVQTLLLWGSFPDSHSLFKHGSGCNFCGQKF